MCTSPPCPVLPLARRPQAVAADGRTRRGDRLAGIWKLGDAAGLRRPANRQRGPSRRSHRTADRYGAATTIPTVRAALTLWFVVGVGLDLVGFRWRGRGRAADPAILAQTVLIANLVLT